MLNSRLIISYVEFVQLNPARIQKLEIYDEPTKTPARWSSLTEYGLVSLKTKRSPRYKSRPVTSFGRRLGLPRSVRYQVNGQPLQDLSLRITPEAIGGFDIVREKAAAPVLNIRIGQGWPVSPPPPPGSPPQIYIRGLAGF